VDPIALALVLAAAVVHAVWNRALHDTSDRTATLAVAGLAGGIILLPATLTAPPLRVLPLVGLSALVEMAYALCLSAAYKRGALSLTYPVGRGTAPLLVTLGGWLVLAEPPTLATVAGAIALAAGLVLVATATQHRAQRAATGFALLVGVSIAAYSLIDARAVQQVSPASYLGAVLTLQGIVLAAWVGRTPARLRAALRPGAAVAIGTVAAYLLVLLAFQRTGAGRVATLRETSVLVGLLLTRETLGRRVWLGAALVVAGAIIVASGS